MARGRPATAFTAFGGQSVCGGLACGRSHVDPGLGPWRRFGEPWFGWFCRDLGRQDRRGDRVRVQLMHCWVRHTRVFKAIVDASTI